MASLIVTNNTECDQSLKIHKWLYDRWLFFYELIICDTPRVVILRFDDHHVIFIWQVRGRHFIVIWRFDDRHLIAFDNLMTVTSSSFDDFMTVSSSSFDDFMTVKPGRRAWKFKPYFTYMDMKNMRQDIHPMVLHHSGYGNSNTLYMDYSPIFIGQRIWTSRLLRVSVENMAIPNCACADSISDNFRLVRLQLWTKTAHMPVLYLTMQ